jgi:hypothetical protein
MRTAPTRAHTPIVWYGVTYSHRARVSDRVILRYVLIDQLLAKEEDKRLSMADILRHEVRARARRHRIVPMHRSNRTGACTVESSTNCEAVP